MSYYGEPDERSRELRHQAAECGECGRLGCQLDHEALLFDPATAQWPFWYDAADIARETAALLERQAVALGEAA